MTPDTSHDLPSDRLARAYQAGRPDAPATVLVRDAHHDGTRFRWNGNEWMVDAADVTGELATWSRLAVVDIDHLVQWDSINGTIMGFAEFGDEPSIRVDLDPLHYWCLACDLYAGEWIVPAEYLHYLHDAYGGRLRVKWLQAH